MTPTRGGVCPSLAVEQELIGLIAIRVRQPKTAYVTFLDAYFLESSPRATRGPTSWTATGVLARATGNDAVDPFTVDLLANNRHTEGATGTSVL